MEVGIRSLYCFSLLSDCALALLKEAHCFHPCEEQGRLYIVLSTARTFSMLSCALTGLHKVPRSLLGSMETICDRNMPY